jgi:hypothetical protein
MLCKMASIFLSIRHNNLLATSDANPKASFTHILGMWWRDIALSCDPVRFLKKVVDDALIYHFLSIHLKRLLF